jgi:hypothetical protein
MWIALLGLATGVILSWLAPRVVRPGNDNDRKGAALNAPKVDPSQGVPLGPTGAPLRPWRSPAMEPLSPTAAGEPKRASEMAGPESTTAAPPQRTRPSRQEIEAHHLAQHNRMLETHRSEARDIRWAPDTEGIIVKNLAEIGKEKFDTVKVECKTTTCTANLEWPSYQRAVATYSDLLHFATEVNCAREILLPEPKDPEAPYQATFVLEHCLRGDSQGDKP